MKGDKGRDEAEGNNPPPPPVQPSWYFLDYIDENKFIT